MAPTDIRTIAVEYNRALGEGDLDRVAELLHPELDFDGTARPSHGRDAYVAALPPLVRVLTRNDLKAVLVDGDQAFLLYDFVTDTPAGAVLSGELLRIEDGLIRSITLLFDWRRWPEVIAEVQRRAAAATSATAAA